MFNIYMYHLSFTASEIPTNLTACWRPRENTISPTSLTRPSPIGSRDEPFHCVSLCFMVYVGFAEGNQINGAIGRGVGHKVRGEPKLYTFRWSRAATSGVIFSRTSVHGRRSKIAVQKYEVVQRKVVGSTWWLA